MLSNQKSSSIAKKQIVAVTGLLLILYVIAHLCGNLLIYLGPEWFNKYAETLAGLRPGLYVIEAALLLVFLTHVHLTVLLVLENIRSAGTSRYQVNNSKRGTPWATRLRVYTGLFIFAFVVWHLVDFTFANREVRGMLGGHQLGLYGVVYNSFLNPIHSGLYIIAMGCVGFHLAHGIQSFMQTFGFDNQRCVNTVRNISNWTGGLIALGFSSIPVYVMINGVR